MSVVRHSHPTALTRAPVARRVVRKLIDHEKALQVRTHAGAISVTPASKLELQLLPLCIKTFLGTEYLLQGGKLGGIAAGKLL